ncbi:glutathione S-transferase [Rhodobacterales bacterium HKCCE2091]|nr:glutathione S-transferase [Rhodobacterales bacterium HKCCE2091]
MYKVIGRNASRAFRVLWMLEELGLDYEHDPADPHAESVYAADPGGKLPVLVTDEGTLWDSVAIMAFLGDRHGALTHPAGTFARARQDALTQMIVDEFDQVLWTAARHSFVLPKEHRVAGIKDSLRWEFTRNQKRFVARMGSDPFLAGDSVTIPDIVLAHCIGWAHAAKFEVTEPLLADHAARMQDRPSFRALTGG